MKKLISVLLIIGAIFSLTISFAQTVGLMLHNPETEDGYVLFAPSAYNKTYLIDKCGKLVHTWTSGYNPGLAVYLLNNGKLLRTGNTSNTTFNSGGKGGIIELLDTNSTVQWSYLISNAMECQHHDIYPLPNGNILAIVWEKKSQAEAIAEGRNPALLGTSLWSEKIIEVQPTGSSTGIIVWQWHVWDHLIQDYSSVQPNFGIVSLHPELINLNYYTGTATQADWLHINAISYNPSFNQIMISSHNFSEIWIIDHSTTSSEAASHIGGTYGKGGDLLYRWGNPAAYNRGTVADKKFFGQHNPHWITPGYRDENNILVFNNGLNRPVGNYSSVEILSLPVDTLGNYSVPVSAPFLPDSAYWKYIAPVPTDFYSNNISGAQRLSNGNTIICEGNKGNYFEIDTNNIIVWKYVNPVNNTGPVTQNTSITNNSVFRCTQIPFGYAGLNGYNLSQGSPVELNPLPYACSMTSVSEEIISKESIFTVYPNPFRDELTIVLNSEIVIQNSEIKIFNSHGKLVCKFHFSPEGAGFKSRIYLGNLRSGIYFYQISSDNKIYSSGKIIAE